MTGEKALHNTIENLHGPSEVLYGEEELVVVCLVRDGRPYVRSFIEHYRTLGARHIAFLDNGSTDGTVEALRDYEGVTVLRTALPYKLEDAPLKNDPVGNGWTRECLFKQYLFSRFGGRDRWCLCADIDELFDYPYSDVIGLGSFLAYLGEHSYTAVAAQMIDMFPGGPLSGEVGSADEPLKERHRFCDLSNVSRRSITDTKILTSRNSTAASEEVEVFKNGIRATVFGTEPDLTKFPLVFLDGETKPMDRSSHRVGNARVADVTCALFHYKFVDAQLHRQVAQAVREEHRIMNSAKYKMYQQVLDENPSLLLKRESAVEVTGVNDLLDAAVLVVSEEYVGHVDSEEAADAERNGGLNGASLEARRREREKTLVVQRLDQRLRHELGRPRRRNRELEKRSTELQRQVRESSRSSRAPEQGTRASSGGRAGSESEQETQAHIASSTPERPLADGVRPLFVCGCQCSGTTAFADYINEHDEALVCQERYKGVPRRKIGRGLFEFDKILSYGPEEIDNPDVVEWKIEQHAKILSGKDPRKLKWAGDKNPDYVDQMNVLANHNPGARFIVLHRPVEEVAESFESRSKNPDYFWFSKGNGFERGVELWNRALKRTKDFLQNNPDAKVLIVNYHDFFSDSEAYIPALSCFLEIGFEEEISKTWRDLSLDFESRRRKKRQLTGEQRSFVEEHADRETERWLLERIERQWEEPALYAHESKEAALSSLAKTEAGAWKLEQRMKNLERDLENQRGEAQEDRRRLQSQTAAKQEDLAAQRRRADSLQRQLEGVVNSKTWRVLDRVNRLKKKALDAARNRVRRSRKPWTPLT